MIPFDPTQFKIDFPRFANISDAKLTAMFNGSASVLAIPVTNSVCEDTDKYYWQCVVLAHILQLEEYGITGTPQSFGQGSDSGAFHIDLPQWANWWGQSPYGQQCYQLIQQRQGGGHFFGNGEMPYMSNAMNGMYQLGGYPCNILKC